LQKDLTRGLLHGIYSNHDTAIIYVSEEIVYVGLLAHNGWEVEEDDEKREDPIEHRDRFSACPDAAVK
jgi:hypothetical protein